MGNSCFSQCQNKAQCQLFSVFVQKGSTYKERQRSGVVINRSQYPLKLRVAWQDLKVSKFTSKNFVSSLRTFASDQTSNSDNNPKLNTLPSTIDQYKVQPKSNLLFHIEKFMERDSRLIIEIEKYGGQREQLCSIKIEEKKALRFIVHQKKTIAFLSQEQYKFIYSLFEEGTVEPRFKCHHKLKDINSQQVKGCHQCFIVKQKQVKLLKGWKKCLQCEQTYCGACIKETYEKYNQLQFSIVGGSDLKSLKLICDSIDEETIPTLLQNKKNQKQEVGQNTERRQQTIVKNQKKPVRQQKILKDQKLQKQNSNNNINNTENRKKQNQNKSSKDLKLSKLR